MKPEEDNMPAPSKAKSAKQPRVPGRRNPATVGTVHSIRCTDELWTNAKARADREGVTMNYVITEIMEGYARGLMDLPVITKTFIPTREEVVAA
jgi:hypothetical protein